MYSVIRRPLVAVAFTALCAAPIFLAAPRCAAQGVTIPEKTEVPVLLAMDLKSGDNKEGSEVKFEVARDVTDDKSKLLIKAGTPAIGKVTKSSHKGAFGKPGKIDFTCEYLLMPDGTKVPLRASSLASYGRDNRTATVATAVLLAPAALFINGRDVTVKKGTAYTMFVDKATSASGGGTTPTTSAPAPSSGPKSVYTTKDGKTYVGSLVSFDGTTYTISTESSGNVKIPAADVKTVTPVQ